VGKTTLQKVRPGDIVSVNLRGARSYEGACVELEDDTLRVMYLANPDRDFATIPSSDITTIYLVRKRENAIPLHTNNRATFGALVSITYEEHRYYGEITAAWKGVVVLKTSQGEYFRVDQNAYEIE